MVPPVAIVPGEDPTCSQADHKAETAVKLTFDEVVEKLRPLASQLADAVLHDSVKDAMRLAEDTKVWRRQCRGAVHEGKVEEEEVSKFFVLAYSAYKLKGTHAAARKNEALLALLNWAGGCDVMTKQIKRGGSRSNDYRTPFLLFAETTELVEEDIQTSMLALLHLAAREKGDVGKVIAPNGNDKQQSVFFMAAWYNRVRLLEGMITLTRSEKCETTEQLLLKKDPFGYNALHVAVNRANFEAVKVILDNCLCESLLTAHDDGGRTALHMAIDAKNMKILTLLLRKVQETIGADGQTPVWEKLEGVFSYSNQVNAVESFMEAAMAVPEAFGADIVAKVMGMTDAIAIPLAEALAPELKVHAWFGPLWVPQINLGSDAWVKQIKCRKPVAHETRHISEKGYADREVKVVIDEEEVKLAEHGPQGLQSGRIWGRSQVECRAYILPEHLLKSRAVLHALTKASSTSRTPLARGLLAHSWTDIEWYYHVDIALNFFHMGLAGGLTFLSRNERSEEGRPYLILAAVLLSKDVLDELLVIADVFCAPRYRKFNPQTIQYWQEQCVDYGRMAIETWALVVLWHQEAGQAADIATKTVTAAWVFLWWCHCLFDLRGLRFFGPSLMPIFSAISNWNVKSVALVVFSLLAASSHAYYVMGVRGGPSHIYAAVLHMYRLGVLGDFDMFELEGQDHTLVAAGEDVWQPVDPEMSAEYELVHCLFYIVTLSITVVLMNLFIGVLGSSYDKSLDMSEELFLSTRAQLVLEYRVALIPRLAKPKERVVLPLVHFAKTVWAAGKRWMPSRRMPRRRQGSEELHESEDAGAESGTIASGTGASNKKPDFKPEKIVVFMRREDMSSDQSIRNFVRGEVGKSTEQLEGKFKKLEDEVKTCTGTMAKEMEEVKKLLKQVLEAKGGPGESNTGGSHTA